MDQMPKPSRLARAGYKLAGLTCFVLGGIGLAVPLMPTTVFWLVAALCLLRAGDRRAHRLLDHPRLGPGIRLFLEQGAIGRPVKAAALTGLLAAAAIPPLLALPPAASAAGWAVLAAVAAWIVSRPEPALARRTTGRR